MTATELQQWMDDPALLTTDTLDTLRQAASDYPYFHTARMLYLKNMAVAGSAGFAEELRRTAVAVPDRRQLFILIESGKYEVASPPESKPETSLVDTFALIDDYLSAVQDKNEPESGSSLLFHPSVSSDYMYWSLTQTQASGNAAAEEPSVKMKHQELIDDFIRNDEQGATRIDLAGNADKAEYVFSAPAETPTMEDTGCFTETLARIYIKQKRYEKALQIIKNLSLKYPEKNIYFADQIRFLEKLIINTKK